MCERERDVMLSFEDFRLLPTMGYDMMRVGVHAAWVEKDLENR